MATCYICGKSHAEYRRSVHVGNSNRVGITSRGRINSSTTAHYGVRSVCAKCALDIDYHKRKDAGNWGIGVGAFFVIFAIPMFTPAPAVAACSLILGVILLIAPYSIAHSNAEDWYKENSEKYVDSYDLERQIKLNYQTAKQIENQTKQKDTFQEMANAFGARIEQEMKLIDSKAGLLNALFDNKTVNSIEECDKILATLKSLETEGKAQHKELQTFCNDYIKQIKQFDFDKKFIEDFISTIEKVKMKSLNAVNEFINEIKAGENQLLQAKINIIAGERKD